MKAQFTKKHHLKCKFFKYACVYIYTYMEKEREKERDWLCARACKIDKTGKTSIFTNMARGFNTLLPFIARSSKQSKMSKYIKYVKYGICDNNASNVSTQGWFSICLTTSTSWAPKNPKSSQSQPGREPLAGLTSVYQGPPVCLQGRKKQDAIWNDSRIIKRMETRLL